MLSNSGFWKTGADPEAVLYSKKYDCIISATSLCGGRGAMSTRIGTDGHASTLELRPSPSKSVLVVMADVGEALLEINKFLSAVNEENEGLGLTVVAQASFKNEPLGGHIHVSYKKRKDSTDTSLALQTGHASRVHALVRQFTQVYQEYDPSVRDRDRGCYGEGGEVYRSQPGGANFERFEYRRPPTWLSTPLITYCYLGLAKLAMVANPEHQNPRNREDNLVAYVTRLVSTLDHAGELKSLPAAVKKFTELEAPKEPLFVQFDRWAKFLNGGK